VIQKCDGRTLSQTPDGSVDLVHAHKLFVTSSSSSRRDIWKRWLGWCVRVVPWPSTS
jgi:hypothetical protein